MTPKEAIITCQIACDDCKRNHIFVSCIEEQCANYIKIKALEKQLPRKPQDKFSTHAIIDNGEYIDNIDFMTFECPVCNGVLASGEIEKEDCTNIHYCENCGQAIDWSDT